MCIYLRLKYLITMLWSAFPSSFLFKRYDQPLFCVFFGWPSLYNQHDKPRLVLCTLLLDTYVRHIHIILPTISWGALQTAADGGVGAFAFSPIFGNTIFFMKDS